MSKTSNEYIYQEKFGNVIDPLKMTLLLGHGGYFNLTCLYSSDQGFQMGEAYSLYHIPSLLRTLGTRADILAEHVYDELYENSAEQICYILDWDDFVMKVFLFDISNLKVFNEENFVRILQEDQEHLAQIFQMAYYDYMAQQGY